MNTNEKTISNYEMFVIGFTAILFLAVSGFTNVYAAIVVTAIVNSIMALFLVKNHWQKFNKISQKHSLFIVGAAAFIFVYYIWWIW